MVVYVDETNFNIHTSKSKGWVKKGVKSVVKMHSTKTPNLNILMAVSRCHAAIVHFQPVRGGVTKEVFGKI